MMKKELEEFIKTIREAEASGAIRCTKPLTDYDLAIQYVLGKIAERKGTPCECTVLEIWKELRVIAPEFTETEGEA